MKKCAEMLKIVQRSRDSRLDLAGGSRLQAAKCWTRAKHARSWSLVPIGALQDKKYRLAVQLPHDWNSRLTLVSDHCLPKLFPFNPAFHSTLKNICLTGSGVGGPTPSPLEANQITVSKLYLLEKLHFLGQSDGN